MKLELKIPKRSSFHKIVNYFLGFFIALFVIILLILGFTQTSTFREFARKQILSALNDSLNGKIDIRQIDGTIFTTLTVREASLFSQGDTIISVDKVQLHLLPLAIFTKTISAKSLLLSGIDARLYSDSSGALNISKVFPSKPEDTTSSEFPFKIKVRDLKIEDLNLILCSDSRRNDLGLTDGLDLTNFRIKSMRMQLNGDINISRKDFQIDIGMFQFISNIDGFNLKNLSGSLHINKSETEIKDLHLITDRSDLLLNVSLEKMDILGENLASNLRKAPLRLSLKAVPFSFADLNTFITSTSFLSNKLEGEISAEGSLNDLKVTKIDLQSGSTRLFITGRLEDIMDGSKMKIFADLSNSAVSMDDLKLIMPELTIPQFKGYEKVLIDSLGFNGTPLVFTTTGKISSAGGILRLKNDFNFAGDESEYDIALTAGNIDLAPFVMYPSTFNGSIKLKGKNFNPEAMYSQFLIDGAYSIIGRKVFQNMQLSGTAEQGNVNAFLQLHSQEDSLFARLSAAFAPEKQPEYSLSLESHHFNLRDLMMDSNMVSDLNFRITANGRSFDIDKITGDVKLQMDSSNLSGKNIAGFDAKLNMLESSEGLKNIILSTDIIDAEISGTYTVMDLIDASLNEIDSLDKRVVEKISKYFPGIKTDTSAMHNSTTPDIAVKEKREPGPVDAHFSFTVKDAGRINSFLNGREVSIDGQMSGRIIRNSDSSSLSMDADVTFFKYLDSASSLFLEEARFGFAVSHMANENSFEHLNADMNFSANRLFLNQNIRNVNSTFILRNGLLASSVQAEVNDNMSARLESRVRFETDSIIALIDRINLKYNLYELKNNGTAVIASAGNVYSVKNFQLWRGDTKYSVNGIINPEGQQDLDLIISNAKGYDLAYSLLEMPANDVIDNDLNAKLKIRGTFENPIAVMEFSADNITYRKRNFGSLSSSFNYANHRLDMSLAFLEKTAGKEKKRMNIQGFLPVDMKFGSVEERFIKDEPMMLSLQADDFDLASLGDLVPQITNLRGILQAQINMSGTWNQPKRDGFLRLLHGGFKLDYNNLDYGAGMLLTLNDRELSVDSLLINNISKVKNKGKLTGHGKIDLTDPENIEVLVRLNGNLTVLGEDSKTAASKLYGELFIESSPEIVFTMSHGYSFLKMPLLIREAAVTFPPTTNEYSGSGENFYYRYPERKTVLSQRDMEIMELLSKSAERDKQNAGHKTRPFDFDYEIKVSMRDEASFVFVFAQEANQRLNALLKGDILFEQKSGIRNFQGELKVMEGSTLEFIKTFTATGSLQFESDVTNPNLNITGIYKGYYTDNDTTKGANAAKEEEVAVKVKLKGPIRDLAKNFTQSENNIGVFYGKSNIEKDIASTEYDKADAIWFVLLGKFKKDITQQDRSSAAGQIDPITGTATSVASSLISGLFNAYFGDVVRSLDFRTVGSSTKFNLSGRYKNFRYTIGGSTNFLQDFSSANIRIEYPIFERLFIRVERKEATTSINYNNEMINELGFRYSFEF